MNRKAELQKELDAHKKAINDDISNIKTTGKKIALSSLVVGGAFFLSYSIARGIASARYKHTAPPESFQGAVYNPPPPPKPVKSGIGKKVGGIIMTELAILLVGLAKKELKTFISRINLGDEQEDTE